MTEIDLSGTGVFDPAQTVAGDTPPALPDSDQGRFLPFAFAKRHGVLIQAYDGDVADTLARRNADPASLAEVRRFAGARLRLKLVDPEEFDLLLQQTYERETDSTMQMVEGLGEDTDLLQVAQELPEPSDLLESDDITLHPDDLGKLCETTLTVGKACNLHDDVDGARDLLPNRAVRQAQVRHRDQRLKTTQRVAR